VFGAAVRLVWVPGPAWIEGVDFASKTLLEFAIVLLGASMSIGLVMAQGPGLVAGIAAAVTITIVVTYASGRAMGLTPRLSMLVACGNSICGNSAIAAVAPVIRAEAAEVASSLAFTAVLGVAIVLVLPLLGPSAGLSPPQYGVVAGLTVYAVPQVLAATFHTGLLSTQMGTFVKLMRVLMLGPVVMFLSFVMRREDLLPDKRNRFLTSLSRYVPWFMIGFALFATARSFGWIPVAALNPIVEATGILTVVAMAALGLSVDLRALRHAAGSVIATSLLAIALLGGISAGLIHVLGIH
jgi:uncharacterized integral membrane protein (TIGR00698 family)